MQEPDAILVARAQQGDRAAMDELLRLAQQPLYRYLASVLSDSAAAEDVLQETLFRIARKLRWLENASSFRPWAFRIASREAYRHHRRAPDERPLDAETNEPAIEPDVHRLDVTEELRTAVDSLSPASRTVVSLYYLHELTLEEVALALEVPLGTVKSRLAYGLKQLRASLVQR